MAGSELEVLVYGNVNKKVFIGVLVSPTYNWPFRRLRDAFGGSKPSSRKAVVFWLARPFILG